MTLAIEDMLNAATIAAGPFSEAVTIDVNGTVSEMTGVLLDGDDTRPVGHTQTREPGRHVRVQTSDLTGVGVRQAAIVTVGSSIYRITSIEPDSAGQTKLFLRLAGAGDVMAYGDSEVDANAVYTLTLAGTALVQEYTVNWGDGNTTVVPADGGALHSYLEAADSVTITVDVVGNDGVTYPRAAVLTLAVNATATADLVRDYTLPNIGADVEFFRESASTAENYDGQIEEIPDHSYPLSGYLVCQTFFRNLSTKTKTFDDASWTAQSNVTMVPDTDRYIYRLSAATQRAITSDQTTGGFAYANRDFLVVIDIEPIVDTSINFSIRDASTNNINMANVSLSVAAADGRQVYAVRLPTTAGWTGNVVFRLFDDSGSSGDMFYLYALDLQDVTHRAEQDVPRPMTSYGEGDNYNSGADGIQYIADDYSGSSVDGSYIVDYQTGTALTGYLDWQPPVTNLALGSHDWTSAQTIAIPEAGQWTISLRGTVTVTVAADTAVGTGWGDVTEASPLTIDVTTPGDITLTKGAGDFDLYANRALIQCEAGPINTAIHPTEDVPRTRDSMALGYNDTGLAGQSGMIVTKFRLTNDPNIIGAGSGILTYDPYDNASVYTPDEDSDLYSDDPATFAAGDTVVSVVAYNDFWGQMRAAYSVNGGAFVEDEDVQEYEDDYETVGLNDFFVSPDFPIQIEALYVYATNPGLDWATAQDW